MTQQFSALPNLPLPFLVADAPSLDKLVHVLQKEPCFAVDTESNSLFAYRERVCLIQFSTPTQDYVLDPLCFSNLEVLAPIFANRDQQKVFHAADYDILCMRRDYGFVFAGVFDTMLAARLLGWAHVGLAAILELHFGVRLNKRHQRADWGRRPLTRELIDYARLDTHYLLDLRNLQFGQLEKSGRMEDAQFSFSRIEQVQSKSNGFDPHGFWKISGARELTPQQLAVLRELYLYRERQAEHANRPPFKILGNQTLLEIATHRPRQLQGLKSAHGMTPGQIHRFGEGLLKAVERGLSAPHPIEPRRRRLRYKPHGKT